ncbi:FAD:protein FMN transferase [Gallaecimonas kandeliae]|uniref:FAD:protein FMN transferase n=1 Tax=Gallaecimonas kandeliae TaxID=3029055 RepID=UPI0026499799|nr:FAD:protein FMN transferase [Gallaecimonas kandeliae]WKE64887.1 FAD:protein FMN transferase [Gallaecimonas kandeliae]
MQFKAVIKWLAFGLAFLLVACSQQPAEVKLAGRTMGTGYHISYYDGGGLPAPQDVKAAIDARLVQVNNQMSHYQPDSELSRFNKSSSTQPFPVSPATAKVIGEALRIGKLSEGAYDVTIGPVVNLWSFGPEKRPERVPTDAELAQRMSEVGQDKLHVVGNTLVKDRGDINVNLSSIAKGYGVDVVGEYLESLGIANYVVEIGGEVRVHGSKPKGEAWRIAIEKPDVNGEAVQEVITPGNMAVATSGDYRNYFEENGVRYSHLIDARTGKPIQNRLVSVTVVAPTCMVADGFSTAVSVLGPEKGLELAKDQGLAVFLVVKTDSGFEERYTDNFKPYLVSRH